VTAPASDYRRAKQLALITLVGASLVLGIIEVALGFDGTSGIAVLGNLALLFIGFRWLQLDAAELDIRRPLWLTVAMVLAAAIFVPYYLYKTRPEGKRAPAILAFFGVVLGCGFAVELGAALMLYFSGAPAPTGA
jgi:hypothetical protein